MRVFLPASGTELSHDVGIPPRYAHAVTESLRRSLPEEDDEALAEAARAAAADESISHIRTQGAVPRRIVISADVTDVDLPVQARTWQEGDERLPSTVEVATMVPWRDVAAFHVDEPAAEQDVAAAAADGEDARALEAAASHDLLWYDVSEREALAAELARLYP